MPGSRVRRSTRKREPPQKFEPTEASSPSRPAKRRKGQTTSGSTADPEEEELGNQRLAHEGDTDQDIEAEEQSSDAEDDDDEKTEAQQRNEQVAALIPHLTEAPEPVNAQHQHPDVDRVVTANAKIAGRQWTFYSLGNCITIGRQGEKKPDKPGHDSDDLLADAAPDIDLGPGKHVSREHAEIRWQIDEKWWLTVLGRNGAKVNNVLVKKGQSAVIRSGDVVEIAGTEMIFVSAVAPAIIQDIYLERLLHPKIANLQEVHHTIPPQQVHSQTQPVAAPVSHYLQQSSDQFVSPYGPPIKRDQMASELSDRPLTPTKSPVQQHPYLAQQLQLPKPSVNNQESSEQIDYSNEANKEVKPPMSYATLIAQAILAGPNERSSLNGIYEWIKTNFAYYRHIDAGWQNSIRHNLSLNQAFDKVARESHEPGKGGMWFIVPEKKDDFKRMGWKMTSRGGARPSSNPSSPAPAKNKSPKRRTPPRAAKPVSEDVANNSTTPSTSQQSQTPLRQTTTAATLPRIDPTPQLMTDNSPLPVRQALIGGHVDSAKSPTMLSSSFLDETAASAGHFANPLTPAPRRQEPTFNAPSTAKLPSQYLLQSSPAPFWKDFGTPTALPQTSPLKVDQTIPAKTGPTSSSPPREGANGSPTRPRGKTEVGLGLTNTSIVSEHLTQSGQLDLMGSFPQIGAQIGDN